MDKQQKYSLSCNYDKAGEAGGNCYFPSLAMVYGVYQEFEEIYDCPTALTRGTLFRTLDKPFDCGSERGLR